MWTATHSFAKRLQEAFGAPWLCALLYIYSQFLCKDNIVLGITPAAVKPGVWQSALYNSLFHALSCS